MVRLKICGHRQKQDLAAILPYLRQIDHIGFIMTPQSKRYVSPQQVADWLREDTRLRTKAVAVCLDQGIGEVMEILSQTGISQVQLHGTESREYCERLRKLDPQLVIWKAISLPSSGTENLGPNFRRLLEREIDQYLGAVDVLLLDTQVKRERGGTGQTFNWQLIHQAKEILIRRNAKDIPLFVAGGISPHNVGRLVNCYPVDGVDLASGVETEGQKDGFKIKAVLSEVKQNWRRQGWRTS